MMDFKGKKAIYKPLDNIPKCVNCSQHLVYMDCTYHCTNCGIYYVVKFNKKGFSYEKIGEFGNNKW